MSWNLARAGEGDSRCDFIAILLSGASSEVFRTASLGEPSGVKGGSGVAASWSGRDLQASGVLAELL